MNEEHQKAEIFYTHFHRAFERNNANCDDTEVLSFQLRQMGVEQIRLIQAGKLAPSETVLKNLHDINALLREFNKPILDFDFSHIK